MYEFSFSNIFFFEGCGYRLNLHVLTHSFPTRRSSYLDVRAIASSISPALFVEKVRVEVTEPARTGLVVGDDLGSMIDEAASDPDLIDALRSEEHTSKLQSLMRTSYAVFCLKTKNTYIPLTQDARRRSQSQLANR